jgi:hypothetical protein
MIQSYLQQRRTVQTGRPASSSCWRPQGEMSTTEPAHAFRILVGVRQCCTHAASGTTVPTFHRHRRHRYPQGHIERGEGVPPACCPLGDVLGYAASSVQYMFTDVSEQRTASILWV